MSAQLRRLLRPLQRLAPARPLSGPSSPLPTSSTSSTSSASSSTAVSAATPATALHGERAQRLQKALRDLAGLGVADQSRVQLALRSLEQADAPVRVAVLAASARGLRAPARFLRLLLAADSHAHIPGPQWEEAVASWGEQKDQRGGLLLRYATTPSPITPGPNSPISVLALPSPFLLHNNIEILLSRLPPTLAAAAAEVHVPTLLAPLPPQTPTPTRATGMVMRYPVHKTIIFADGLEDLITASILRSRLAEAGDAEQQCVLNVASLAGIDHRLVKEKLSDKLALLDLESTNSSSADIEKIRGWLTGPEETKALAHPTFSNPTRTLISSIFAISSAKLTSGVKNASPLPIPTPTEEIDPCTTSAPLNPDNIKSLTTGMQELFKTAHHELHTSLGRAFASRYWTRDLAWYRLYFNHENISYFASMAVNHNFLPETEKSAWAFAGRMWGSGFRNFSGKLASEYSTGVANGDPPPTPVEIEIETVIAAADSAGGIPLQNQNSGLPSLIIDRPFLPPHIPASLNHIMTVLIPRLHNSGVNHVIKSSSIAFSSILTTTLLYFSEIPLYTSFSTTAVGGLFSILYMQRKWAKDKRRFQCDVIEVGRKSITQLEKWGWDVLRTSIEQTVVANKNAAAVLSPEEVRIQKALRAVDDGNECLRFLEGGKWVEKRS